MDQREFEYWQAVTSGSEYRWVEDAITRLNGNGALYYSGGEDGIYMRLSPDGKLTAGTYSGAILHIGEALFQRKSEHQYDSFDEAFQAACQLGGAQFLADMFSDGFEQSTPKEEINGMDMTM